MYIQVPPAAPTSDDKSSHIMVLPGDNISINISVPPNSPVENGNTTIGKEDHLSIHLQLKILDMNDMNQQNAQYHGEGYCHQQGHGHDHEHGHCHGQCPHHKDGGTNEEDINSNDASSQYVSSDCESDKANPASAICRIRRPSSLPCLADISTVISPDIRSLLSNAMAGAHPANNILHRRSLRRLYPPMICGVRRPTQGMHAPVADAHKAAAVEVEGTPIYELANNEHKLPLRFYQDLHNEIRVEPEDIYGYERGGVGDNCKSKAKNSNKGNSKNNCGKSAKEINISGEERSFEAQLKMVEELEELARRNRALCPKMLEPDN